MSTAPCSPLLIANHPIFNGGAIGRAAEWDFKLFGGGRAYPRGADPVVP